MRFVDDSINRGGWGWVVVMLVTDRKIEISKIEKGL
jgi:hypothetical protein